MFSMRESFVIFLFLPLCKSTFAPASKEELSSAVKSWVENPSSASKMFGNISQWDVSKITDMSKLFQNYVFNADLSEWDVSNVNDMSYMFFTSTDFNCDLSRWNVSRVTDMTGMFDNGLSFNGEVSKWDVSKVTNMFAMFSYAHNFNGDLSKWSVPNVIDMGGMFEAANSFSSDLSKWDVSRVTRMSQMFSGATSFDADLTKWDVSAVTEAWAMFYGARCSLCDRLPHSLQASCRDDCWDPTPPPPGCNQTFTKNSCDTHQPACTWCVWGGTGRTARACFDKATAPKSSTGGWDCDGMDDIVGSSMQKSSFAVV